MPNLHRNMALSRLGLLGLVLVLLLSGTVLVVLGQDNERVLTPGTSIPGVLDANNLAQVYTFSGASGQEVELTVVSANGQPLALLLTDALGNAVAQTTDTAQTGTVKLTATVQQSGIHYVTVLPAAGVDTSVVNAFVLTFNSSGENVVESTEVVETPVVTETPVVSTPETSTETPATVVETPPAATDASVTIFGSDAPSEILMASGMEVTLTWQGSADMNLQVRQPDGQTLYWDSRSTTRGGSFGFDANGLCETIVDNPTETATWAPGFLSTGSYEVLVYYRNYCDTANPVSFTVNITVDGVDLEPIEGTLLPPAANTESVYIARFVVAGDGSASLNTGDVYAGVNALPAPPQEIVASVQPIERNTPVQDVLTNAQPYVAYSFSGTANELISVDMQAAGTTGNLDTLLLLLDANGNLVTANDDIAGSTNSSIANWLLLLDGNYIIVATRYGKQIGGTEGAYELVLSGPSADVPAAVANLNLPSGDIEISLLWNTNADLQLLVRDPVGDSVFDDEQQINSGGTLVLDGNVACTQAEGDPVSFIYWPVGFLRPGSYEVEVWYQNDCTDTRPVEFTLTTIVRDELVFVERQRPLPGDRFVISFDVAADGSVTANQGGFIGGFETINYLAEIDSAIPMTSGQELTGNLNASNTFDLYSFEGTAGDVVTISMEGLTRTLDTNLYLISPSGIEVASNDDAVPGETTNSLMSDIPLTEDGEYIIIATRFATIYGGTVGPYSITYRNN